MTGEPRLPNSLSSFPAASFCIDAPPAAGVLPYGIDLLSSYSSASQLELYNPPARSKVSAVEAGSARGCA